MTFAQIEGNSKQTTCTRLTTSTSTSNLQTTWPASSLPVSPNKGSRDHCLKASRKSQRLLPDNSLLHRFVANQASLSQRSCYCLRVSSMICHHQQREQT